MKNEAARTGYDLSNQFFDRLAAASSIDPSKPNWDYVAGYCSSFIRSLAHIPEVQEALEREFKILNGIKRTQTTK